MLAKVTTTASRISSVINVVELFFGIHDLVSIATVENVDRTVRTLVEDATRGGLCHGLRRSTR